MPEYRCKVCDCQFAVPQEALDKYPGWTPKYCRKHSPRKKANNSFGRLSVETSLTLSEVLESFSEGPASGIFTDGSARPNPGPGGWGAVKVINGEIVKQEYGSSKETTNNKMELTALIAGLKMAGIDEELTLYTDSELCVNSLTKWAYSWEKNGWKRKTGPIKNLELVQEAFNLLRSKSNVKLEWIKAHNGWLWNEYADSLASAWTREEL